LNLSKRQLGIKKLSHITQKLRILQIVIVRSNLAEEN